MMWAEAKALSPARGGEATQTEVPRPSSKAQLGPE